jgi:hypothetical protein
MPSTLSTSPMRSKASRPGRSSLFTKVKMGIDRCRQTRKSLRVWASTPLALSRSMTAPSTAWSVR